MLDTAQKINSFLLHYCRMMMNDLPDERLAEQPAPGVNHPAWILGHLIYSADRASLMLGQPSSLSAEWNEKFAGQSKPTTVRAEYPSKDELMRRLDEGFARVRREIDAAAPEVFTQPFTRPGMKDALPTIKDALGFMLTGHLAVHLGQLSTWRRLIGLPPLF